MSLSLPVDFVRDVLEQLKSRRVTFHGCPPWSIEQEGNNVKIWFAGDRNGKQWRGGVTIISPDVESALATGHSTILAQLCEQIIDDNHLRFDRKINIPNP